MEERYREILARRNAILTDSHVVYASGRHGTAYVNKDAIFPYTAEVSEICRGIAEPFKDDAPDVVIGPVVGGAILSQRVAEHLSDLTGRTILSVYADKAGVEPDIRFVIKRGFDTLMRGKRVLIVEDVLTTGGSVIKVIKVVRELECEIIGAGALCNRGSISATALDVPRLESLINLTLDMWPEEYCPRCKEGVPINTRVGKGADFLSRRAMRG